MIRLSCSGVLLVCFVLVSSAASQDKEPAKKPPRRFGFDVDELTYPQRTAKDAMKSIATALDRRRVDYMLAQLVDPHYVDYWVGRYKEKYAQGSDAGRALLAFDRLVQETNQYYQDDPLIHKDLRIFARQAEWTETEDTAVGVVKEIPARKVFLRKIDDRWFLENRQQEEKAAPK